MFRRNSGDIPAANGQHILDNLNPQIFTSQIPVHAAGTKRRNSTSTAGLTNMINKSYIKNMEITKRKKPRFTESDTANTKLSHFNLPSQKQRHSMLPQVSNIFTNADKSYLDLPKTVNRDPRPLREKEFQLAIQQEIFDYLSKNKFSIEVKYPITIKSLQKPTQKVFVFIFEWLYKRLDPGYSFVKSIEQEVYQILKTLQYPYIETINKSQISAVGGNSWPKFLGMLHWLVKINTKLDLSLNKMDQSLLNQNTQEITVLNYPLETQENQDEKQDKYEIMIEQLCINYITDCYKSYLKANEDFSPMMEQLKEEFGKLVHIFETDIKNLHEQNEKVAIECSNLANNYEKIKASKEKFYALNNDVVKFKKYVDVMEAKSQDWPVKLHKMEYETSVKSGEIEELEKSVKTLQENLKKKNISIIEIDNKNKEKENLTNELDLITSKNDQLVSSIQSSKIELQNILKTFNDTLRQYELSLNNLDQERRKLNHNIQKESFHIDLPSNIARNGDQPLHYETFFKNDGSFTIGKTIKSAIQSLNSDILTRIEVLQTDNDNLETELIALKQEMMEKTKLMESVELRLSEQNSMFELKKQEADSKLLTQKIEVEKAERKNNEAEKLIKEKLANTHQLIESTKLKKEEFQLQLDRQRNVMNKKVIDVIEFSSNFKINIQNKLDSLQSFTSEELHLLDKSTVNE